MEGQTDDEEEANVAEDMSADPEQEPEVDNPSPEQVPAAEQPPPAAEVPTQDGEAASNAKQALLRSILLIL